MGFPWAFSKTAEPGVGFCGRVKNNGAWGILSEGGIRFEYGKNEEGGGKSLPSSSSLKLLILLL